MSVNHRRSDVTVTKKRLNCTDVIVCLQTMRGKRVAERMGGNALRELRPPDGLVQRQKEPPFGPGQRQIVLKYRAKYGAHGNESTAPNMWPAYEAFVKCHETV